MAKEKHWYDDNSDLARWYRAKLEYDKRNPYTPAYLQADHTFDTKPMEYDRPHSTIPSHTNFDMSTGEAWFVPEEKIYDKITSEESDGLVDKIAGLDLDNDNMSKQIMSVGDPAQVDGSYDMPDTNNSTTDTDGVATDLGDMGLNRNPQSIVDAIKAYINPTDSVHGSAVVFDSEMADKGLRQPSLARQFKPMKNQIESLIKGKGREADRASKERIKLAELTAKLESDKFREANKRELALLEHGIKVRKIDANTLNNYIKTTQDKLKARHSDYTKLGLIDAAQQVEKEQEEFDKQIKKIILKARKQQPKESGASGEW